MAAECEEIVGRGKAREPQDVLPDRAQRGFQRRWRQRQRRRRLGFLAGPRNPRRIRELAPIDLAGRRERQAIERRDHGRDHVGRQQPAQPGTNRRDDACATFAFDERGEGAIVVAIAEGDDRAAPDGRHRVEDGLDRADFHPEAANLDLLVGTADPAHRTVGFVAAEVAGPVDPVARIPGRRVDDESTAVAIGRADVAPAQVAAADVDLSRFTDAGRAAERIEQQQFRTGDPASDQRQRAIRIELAGHAQVVRGDGLRLSVAP